jgi:hypothetical protein
MTIPIPIYSTWWSAIIFMTAQCCHTDRSGPVLKDVSEFAPLSHCFFVLLHTVTVGDFFSMGSFPSSTVLVWTILIMDGSGVRWRFPLPLPLPRPTEWTTNTRCRTNELCSGGPCCDVMWCGDQQRHLAFDAFTVSTVAATDLGGSYFQMDQRRTNGKNTAVPYHTVWKQANKLPPEGIN